VVRKHVFADEAGQFDFSEKPGASRYFILTTVTLEHCRVGDDLLALRRELLWEGARDAAPFHAATDRQVIRDRVFDAIRQHEFRVDATIIEKRNVVQALRSDVLRFYKTAWYLHLKHVAPRLVREGDDLLVVAASITTKVKATAFGDAVAEVVSLVSPTTSHRTAHATTASDPCLQVADYCSWAVQWKWETGDERSYALIAQRIHTECHYFATH
jgi:hypothetical protein